MLYIGLDDTDNKTSRGTGRLARMVAEALTGKFVVRGVTRHQLLVDPRVPYTSHNSCNVVHLQQNGNADLAALADAVQAVMLADYQPGSDPGLCVAQVVTPAMSAFGQRAKQEVLFQAEAREIAEHAGCVLRGLGGTQDGIIGALAGVALASTGEDGRFVSVGRSRELSGVQPVQAILEHGIAAVRTTDGELLREGMVETGGKLRPALRGNEPVLVVRQQEGNPAIWLALKLD